ncbi:type IX secretion system membrane protein PorP/SprF [Chitinophaga sp.]|uniref:PorP/SprF family type IX secretion system membrane protein n=1 Tax=Chitinophaga sp. TaxID=1869181 RepID=UPI002F92475A
MKKMIVFIVLLLCVKALRAQQDVLFSQYMFNGIYINPAYAGYREQLNVHAFYRDQWRNFPGAPRTMSAAIDASANNARVGLAFQVMNDQLGAESSTSAYGSYSYRIPVGDLEKDNRLAIGIGLGFIQYRLDGTKFDPETVIDPSLMYRKKTVLAPDVKAGIFYNSDRFYAGISVDNLVVQYVKNKQDPEHYLPDKKMHWYATAGMLLPVSEAIQLKPSFLLRDDLAGPTSLDINLFALFVEKLWLGASYRTAVRLYDKSYLDRSLTKPAAFVVMAEFFIADKIRLGYAYDLPLNRIGDFHYSTHEISVGYFFGSRKGKMLTPRYF